MIKTTEALEVAFNPSYEDLKLEYIASIPYCILFCANAEDFVPDTVNGVQGTYIGSNKSVGSGGRNHSPLPYFCRCVNPISIRMGVILAYVILVNTPNT